MCCNHPKIGTRWLYQRPINPKDTDMIANSVDPDQTAAVFWSGSALLAQTYLSEKLGSLPYRVIKNEPPYDKTNNMTVRPAKTQISLGVRPVWPESSLSAQWVAEYRSFLHGDSEDSDQTGHPDAEADLSLRWAHMPRCWSCREAAQMFRLLC